MKSSRIISYQRITKGWSSDKKYKVQLEDGRFGLLRISELAAYDRKQAEFALLHTLSAQTQSIPKPIESWQDEKCSYHLFEWIEGQI